MVAPPSVLAGNNDYRLISGDFRFLPELDFNDLRPILRWNNNATKREEKTISRFAYRLLLGDSPTYFPSRSEAEQALICSLINTGYDLDGIEQLFFKYPGPGKFKEKLAENRNAGIRYLQHSYYSALDWTQKNVSEGRQIAQDAIEWALERPWPGRTGAYDRDVFIAHAQIAWKCGKAVYAASCRELAELSNISHVAAANGTKRLIVESLISLEEPAVANLANLYRIKRTWQFSGGVESNDYDSLSTHDLFCYQGLGKSSKLIVEQLQYSPRTVEELVALTGKTKPTVKKWLIRMSRFVDRWTGEIVPLVYEIDGRWFLVDNPDFDYFAELLQVSGKQKERKRIHLHERELHARSLSMGQSKGNEGNKMDIFVNDLGKI